MEIIAIIAAVYGVLGLFVLGACRTSAQADEAADRAFAEERRRWEEWPWPTR